MIRPTLLDLNLAELNYYPFMISLDKCNGSFNVADDLSTKICVHSETKDINVEVSNITRTYETKILIKHISCEIAVNVKLNANSTVGHVIQIKNIIMVNVNASVKIIKGAKKIIVGILAI